MKRLTKREENNISFAEKREIECGEYCNKCSQGGGNCKTVRDMILKLANFEDLEELIGIPLEELTKIFRQYIPGGCKHPQKAIVLIDGDVDKWREYKAFEKDGRLLKMPRLGEQEKCRECVHTRASCHHRELKCSECPMTELFCDEFYVAIDSCHEEAYASGYLAGIEVGKYKAKSLENDNWEIGYLVKNQEWAYIVKPLENGGFEFGTVDPNTICQCTGLKDKNGNLIWENDIIAYRDCTEEKYVIAWELDKACFEYQQYSCSIMNFDELSSCEVEVIGNIFDNTELLESEE